jgi:hypothetical protein
VRLLIRVVLSLVRVGEQFYPVAGAEMFGVHFCCAVTPTRIGGMAVPTTVGALIPNAYVAAVSEDASRYLVGRARGYVLGHT